MTDKPELTREQVELMACPFCGCLECSFEKQPFGGYWIACPVCATRGDGYNSIADATEAWNRRALSGGVAVMYYIVNNDGKVHWSEGCVAPNEAGLVDELHSLKDDEPDAGWRVAPLYAAAPASPDGRGVRYERVPSLDKRIAHGDDFAGDAYVRWVSVGHHPNEAAPAGAKERA